MFDIAAPVIARTSHPEPDLTRFELRRVGRAGHTKNIYVIPDYQIKLKPDGPWHRRGGIQHETACGESMTGSGGYHSRAFTLDDQLCAECFTKHEIELGRETVIRAKSKSLEPSGGDLVEKPRISPLPKGSQRIPKPKP